MYDANYPELSFVGDEPTYAEQQLLDAARIKKQHYRAALQTIHAFEGDMSDGSSFSRRITPEILRQELGLPRLRNRR